MFNWQKRSDTYGSFDDIVAHYQNKSRKWTKVYLIIMDIFAVIAVAVNIVCGHFKQSAGMILLLVVCILLSIVYFNRFKKKKIEGDEEDDIIKQADRFLEEYEKRMEGMEADNEIPEPSYTPRKYFQSGSHHVENIDE